MKLAGDFEVLDHFLLTFEVLEAKFLNMSEEIKNELNNYQKWLKMESIA